jgi:hypothetical protein
MPEVYNPAAGTTGCEPPGNRGMTGEREREKKKTKGRDSGRREEERNLKCRYS